jgi:hypothetical protein
MAKIEYTISQIFMNITQIPIEIFTAHVLTYLDPKSAYMASKAAKWFQLCWIRLISDRRYETIIPSDVNKDDLADFVFAKNIYIHGCTKLDDESAQLFKNANRIVIRVCQNVTIGCIRGLTGAKYLYLNYKSKNEQPYRHQAIIDYILAIEAPPWNQWQIGYNSRIKRLEFNETVTYELLSYLSNIEDLSINMPENWKDNQFAFLEALAKLRAKRLLIGGYVEDIMFKCLKGCDELIVKDSITHRAIKYISRGQCRRLTLLGPQYVSFEALSGLKLDYLGLNEAIMLTDSQFEALSIPHIVYKYGKVMKIRGPKVTTIYNIVS